MLRIVKYPKADFILGHPVLSMIKLNHNQFLMNCHSCYEPNTVVQYHNSTNIYIIYETIMIL